MKKLCKLLMAIALTVSMCGCSLFGAGDETGGGSADTSIKITEEFTFENPADLDFDTRYVLYNGPETEMIKSGADYGLTGQYAIFYAKEEKLVANYTFLVVETEDDAAAMIQLYQSSGSPISPTEEDGTVLYSYADADVVEANVVTMQSYGMIADTKAQTYIDFMLASYGATLVE